MPGQASIQHPAYSAVSLAILHGSAPHAIVLQVAPGRDQRAFFDHEGFAIGAIQKEIDLIEALGTGKVVALAVNGQHVDDVPAHCARITKETGLPAVDPLYGDTQELLQPVLDHLVGVGFDHLAAFQKLPVATVA